MMLTRSASRSLSDSDEETKRVLPISTTMHVCNSQKCASAQKKGVTADKTLKIVIDINVENASIRCGMCGAGYEMMVTDGATPKRVLGWYREWYAVVWGLKDELKAEFEREERWAMGL